MRAGRDPRSFFIFGASSANADADADMAEFVRRSVAKMILLHAYADGAVPDYSQILHYNQE